MPTPYYHTIVTLPHELCGLALANRKVVYDLLLWRRFRAVRPPEERRPG